MGGAASCNNENKYIQNFEYYKQNYKKEFSGNISDIKRYFLFKGFNENTIDVRKTIVTGSLTWKKK